MTETDIWTLAVELAVPLVLVLGTLFVLCFPDGDHDRPSDEDFVEELGCGLQDVVGGEP